MVTLFNVSESHFHFRSRNRPTSFQVARGQHRSTQSDSFFFMVRRWKVQHCWRQTPPLPRCLFQPCFKIHDSSFQSVMIGRLCHSRMHGTRTLHVQESCTRPHLGESVRSRARARDRAWRLTSLPETRTMALFSPWRFLRCSYRHRDGHSCLVTETSTMAFLAVASGGTSGSVHRQCGGNYSTRMCWNRQRCRLCQLRCLFVFSVVHVVIVSASGPQNIVHLLPKELDEKVTKMHFSALGAELIVLSGEVGPTGTSTKADCGATVLYDVVLRRWSSTSL